MEAGDRGGKDRDVVPALSIPKVAHALNPNVEDLANAGVRLNARLAGLIVPPPCSACIERFDRWSHFEKLAGQKSQL
jgi:hypothetical protein